MNAPLLDSKVYIFCSTRDLNFAHLLRDQLQMGVAAVAVSPILETGMARLARVLDEANIVIFLLSPEALAAEWTAEALREVQNSARERPIQIIPVLLRQCAWKSSDFSRFRLLPENGFPVEGWSNQNDALKEIVAGVFEVAQGLNRPNGSGGAFPTAVRALHLRHSGPVAAIKVARDAGDFVTSGRSGDGAILWKYPDLTSRRLENSQDITNVAISPGGTCVAGFSAKLNSFHIWQDGKEISVPAHGDLFAVTNTQLINAENERILFWDLRNPGIPVESDVKYPVSAIGAFDAFERVFGTSAGLLFRHQDRSSANLVVAKLDGPIQRIALTRHRDFVGLLAGGTWIVDLNAAQTAPRALDHPDAFDISLSADARFAVTAAPHSVVVWDLGSQRELTRFVAEKTITAVGLSPEAPFAIIGFSDGELVEWNFSREMSRQESIPQVVRIPLPFGLERIDLSYLSVLESPRLFTILETLDEASLSAALTKTDAPALKSRFGQHHPPALWSAWMQNVHKDKLGTPPVSVS